jgi:hypothetical protein
MFANNISPSKANGCEKLTCPPTLLSIIQFVAISIYLPPRHLVFFVFSLLGVRLERMLFIIANKISAHVSIFCD